MLRGAVGAVILAGALVLGGCGSSRGASNGGDRPVVRLGTKNFTESFVVGQLYAQALRAKGYRVELAQNVGSSELVDRALTGGAIDLYPEYTGVIVEEIAHQRRRARSAQETYRRAKAFEDRRGFDVLAMSPGFDRLANAVQPATAARYRLRTMADLKRLGRYRYGGFAENRLRFQGAVGVRKAYGARFKYVSLDATGRYPALDRGRVDVIDVLTTEAQLADRSRYHVLSDPKGIFGFQNIVPVVSRGALRAQGPGFARALNAVTALLTNANLRRMNGDVDLRRQPPADVARRFLREHDLL